MADFTGAATNDTFRATAADFQALDSIDGGEGTADTLTVVDTAAFAGFAGATIAGIEVVNVTSGGAVGGVAVLAGVNTAAGTQLIDYTIGTPSATTQNYTVTIAGVDYTTANVGTASAAAAWTAIKDVLLSKLGNSVVFNDTNYSIASKNAGVALPSISVATNASGTGTIAVSDDSVANTTATGGVAVKQVLTMVVSDAAVGTSTATDLAAGDVVKLVIGGVDYTVISSGATATTLASDVAATINGVLGAGAAVASAASVVITAPTAGTPLPTFHLDTSGTAATAASDWGATITQATANQALNATAVSAASVAAPTGTTAYTVVAGGDANVAGVSTAAVDVTGANVRSSGGASAKVTAAGSVYVSGTTGAVTVTETAVDPTGGFYVASNATTGLNADWGSATALKAGTLVTGGSTVTINGRGSALSSTSGQPTGTPDTSAVQVGSAANKGITSANNTTGKETILNAGLAPTGDVSVSSSRSYTRVDATNKVNLSSVIYGDGDTKVYMNGGATASVTGANSVTITDLGTTLLKADAASTAAAGVSKLTSATVNGLNGASAVATINSDALTNLTVLDARGSGSLGVTVNNNTVGGHALNLTVGNSGTSALALTVTDSKATTVNIASAASSFQALGSTPINTGSASFLTLATAAATAIKMTNAQAVSLGDLTGAGYAKLATLDASGATGAVNATIGSTSLQGLAFTGGAGNDTVTVGDSANLGVNTTSGAATTVSLGGGNDTLLNGSSTAAAAPMVGVKIDAGNGIDTVAASLINAGNAAQFVNFEVLGLDRANATTTDANLLSGVTGLALISNGGSGGTVTYANVKASQGLTVAGSPGVNAAGTTVLGFEAAVVAGTSDSYTIGFAGVGAASAFVAPTAVNAGVISLANIETVNISSGSASGFTDNTGTLVAASATSLVVTGSQLATLTLGLSSGGAFGTAANSTNGLGVSSIDASANTGGIKLGFAAGFESAIGALAIKGSAASDTITLAAFDAAVVTVDAGAGNDSITTAAQAVSLTLGAGTDTALVVASKVGTLADTSTNVATLAEATGRLVTIKDAALGDTIDFETATTAGTAAALGAATSVASATSVLDVLNALANSTAKVAWAVFGGNTYVVYDNVNTSTTLGVQADDIVVKFDGTFDFSTALYGATAGALTIV